MKNLTAIENHSINIVRANGVYKLYIDGLKFGNTMERGGVFYSIESAAKFANVIISSLDEIASALEIAKSNRVI